MKPGTPGVTTPCFVDSRTCPSAVTWSRSCATGGRRASRHSQIDLDAGGGGQGTSTDADDHQINDVLVNYLGGGSVAAFTRASRSKSAPSGFAVRGRHAARRQRGLSYKFLKAWSPVRCWS